MTAYRTETVSIFLTAAELARRDFIVTVTSRNAKAVDLLAQAPNGDVVGIQVKGNGKTYRWWFVHPPVPHSPTLFFVFVNLREGNKENKTPEFFVVPSRIVAKNIRPHGRVRWMGWDRNEKWRDKWDMLAKSPRQSQPKDGRKA